MTVSVDGVDKGAIVSPALCEAFLNVYLDKKGVSPALKEATRKTCLLWME